MKKIFFNRKVRRSPWGGGIQFMNALVDKLTKLGHQVTFDLEENLDVIFLMDPRYEDGAGFSIKEIANYKILRPSTKVVHRINECDARKNTNEIDKLLLASNQFADVTVFISCWLKEYFENKGFKKSSFVIYNGCDSSHFYPEKRLNKKPEYPIKFVTHHWSDNWMKGFDAYKEMDLLCQKNPDKYQFTYVGRYSKEYTPNSTRIISPLYGKELGDELRKHDIYITASRWEPCGMHHIEGAASGLPVLYHKDGGGIPEGCKNHGVEFNSNNLSLKIEEIILQFENLRNNISAEYLSIDRCLSDYVKIIEG
jgi:glycosyltransferase involved in cell wall biosynthesis